MQKVPAYPTNAVTPLNLAEARRIADEYLSSPAERAAGYRNLLDEYDICFTVVTAAPPSAGADYGAAVTVIDKKTGCISYWPSWSTDMVAEEYKRVLKAGEVEIQPSWPRY